MVHGRLPSGQTGPGHPHRDVAGTSPAQQITDAKALLNPGAITPQEFETLEGAALT